MKYTNNHILEFLEEWAPQGTKLDYDNVGLLIGDQGREAGKVLVSLDVTAEVIEEAIAANADLIIAHHPLIFRKLSRVIPSDGIGGLIYKLIKNDISLIAAHTNLDAAHGGVSYVLAERLGLHSLRFLKPDDQDETTGFGVTGELPEPHSPLEFLRTVKEKLDCRGIRYSGAPESVKKVAVCGGAGAFLIDDAIQQGADAFVTADLKYHDFFTDTPSLMLVDVGHYESEVPIIGTLCDRLKSRFPEVDVLETSRNTNPVIYFDDKTPIEVT